MEPFVVAVPTECAECGYPLVRGDVIYADDRYSICIVCAAELRLDD